MAKKKATKYKAKKSKPSIVEEPPVAYLTKRDLVRAISKGSKNLAADAIRIMGYTVVVKEIGPERWVVKVDAEGNILEKISRLKSVKRPRKIVLD